MLALLYASACTPDADSGVRTPCTTDDVAAVDLLTHVWAGAASDCEVEALEDFVAGRRETIGPWLQDIHLATSADAITFSPVGGDPILETAAVPEVARADDGRYYLYFVDGDLDLLLQLGRDRSDWMVTHGMPGIGALGLAVSDDGRTFERVDAFEVQGLVAGMAVDPDVVRQPDGTWRMYYVGMTATDYADPASWDEGTEHDVYWATSEDLVHWTQQGIVFRGPFADPSVYCFDDQSCVMASYGIDWSTSADGGTRFNHQGEWGSVTGFAPEFLPLSDGLVRMYYNDMAMGAPLRSFRTGDGVNWLTEDGMRMTAYGEAVTVTEGPDGEDFLLYFHNFKEGIEVPTR